MAGWTVTASTVPIASIHGPDDAEKVAMFSPLGVGNAPYWQDLTWKVRQFLIQEIKRQGSNVTNVTFSANNGTGDSGGIGSLNITLTTS